MQENKCEKLGFEHCWEDITENIVYLTNPPQYPNKKEKCRNCGKVRELVTVQSEVKEWRENNPNTTQSPSLQ